MEIKKLLTEKQRFRLLRQKQLESFRRYLSLSGRGKHVRDYLNKNSWELREYVESMWQPGMDWKNYRKEWVVDHIIPLKFFNPFDSKEMKVCWSYWNLMPAWGADNHVKGCAPEIAVKMLSKLPNVPQVQVLLDKANGHAAEFERYYERN